jgi:hypothetical protein
MPTVCPGQDTRYWHPSDIFDVTCGVCGKAVEFFKDDVSRRCRSCGTMIRNPKISLGCAQWCEHAKECLGYDPKASAEEVADSGSLLDELIAAVKTSLGQEQHRVDRALAVVEEAEELLRQVEADRRIVLASALLHEVGNGSNGAETSPARRLLDQVGVEASTAAEVCRLIASPQGSTEALLLHDALRLADLRIQAKSGGGLGDEEMVGFKTEAGRSRARQLLGGQAS